MNRRNLVIKGLSFVLIAGLTACGKNAELTPDQVKAVKTVSQSTTKSTAAAGKQFQGSGGGSHPLFLSLFDKEGGSDHPGFSESRGGTHPGSDFPGSDFPGSNSNHTGTSPFGSDHTGSDHSGSKSPHNQQPVDLEQELAQKIQTEECKVAGTMTEFNQALMQGRDTPLTLSIGGSGCPILMELVTKQDKNSASIGIKYKVQNEQFRKLSDVDSYEFVTDLFANDKKVGLVFKSGQLHSQQYGDIKFEGRLDAEGSESSKGSGKLTLKLTFPKFEANLRVEGNSEGSKIYLNDKEMEPDFLFEKLANAPRAAQ